MRPVNTLPLKTFQRANFFTNRHRRCCLVRPHSVAVFSYNKNSKYPARLSAGKGLLQKLYRFHFILFVEWQRCNEFYGFVHLPHLSLIITTCFSG